ncbi:MAG: sugar transferase [Gemmatimonadaceae bacterium]
MGSSIAGSIGSVSRAYNPFEFEIRDPATDHVSDLDSSERATRILNVTVAAVALVLAAPIFLFIALLVMVTSRGPVLYCQTRVGLDRRWKRKPSHADVRKHDIGGKPFTMYKFRTMVVEAERGGKEVWAAPNDPRVTPIGRMLRVTRLDELPQFINVLLGDMNVVGPRPERPAFFASLRATVPNYQMRQRVMPGITGLAQISQTYDTCYDDVCRKVEYDLQYLNQRSVKKDLTIMVKTLPVMAMCKMGW